MKYFILFITCSTLLSHSASAKYDIHLGKCFDVTENGTTVGIVEESLCKQLDEPKSNHLIRQHCSHFSPRTQCINLADNSSFNLEATKICIDTFHTTSDLMKCWKIIAGVAYNSGQPTTCLNESNTYSDLFSCLANTGYINN